MSTSLADFATCDLCDANKASTDGNFRVLPPVFRDYGKRIKFAGPVTTVKCFEDNSLVKAALDTPGQGRVLVVDGGASLRRALVGGNLGAAGGQERLGRHRGRRLRARQRRAGRLRPRHPCLGVDAVADREAQ